MFKIVNDNFNSFFDNVIIDNNYSLDEIIEKELGKYILEINAIVVGDGIDSKLFYSYANEKLYKSGPNIVLYSKAIQDIQLMVEQLTKLLEIDLSISPKKENKIDDDDNDK